MSRLRTTFTLILFVCLTSISVGRSYYVTKTGNNANNGQSLATSWLTIGHACSTVVAGDTVNIGPGTWRESHPSYHAGQLNGVLVPTNSGASGRPIVYRSIPDSTRAIISGNSHSTNGFDSYNRNYLRIERLEFTDCSIGVRLFSTDSCYVQYCSIHDNLLSANDNQAGVLLYDSNQFSQWNDGNVVRACTISYNYMTTNNTNIAGIMTYYQRGALIENNVIHNGPDYYTFGIRLKHGTNACVVRGNTVYGCTYPGIKFHTYADNDSVYNNIVYNCGAGISAEYVNPQFGQTKNPYIWNNTIYNCNVGIDVGNSSAGDRYAIVNNNIWNNIVVGSSNDLLVTSQNHTFGILDYNCYYTSGNSNIVYWKGANHTLSWHQSNNSLDLNSVNVNPVFLSTTPGNPNFLHLDALNSPVSVLSGGRGGSYLTYMGAYDPNVNPPPPSIDQIINKSVTQNTATLTDDLSGGTAPYDSLVLHWSTVRANVVGLAARDTRVTSATDPYVFSKTALTAGTKYYFRVLAFDTGVVGDTTAIDSVTTIAIAAIDQVITKTSTSNSATLSDDLSGGVAPYDSLILHWSTVRVNVVSLAARDTRVTAAIDPYVFLKTALTPSTKYYFRVLAFDAGVVGDTTAIDSVTTIAIAAIDQVITKSSTSNSATLSDDLSGGVAPYDSLILHWSTVRANVVSLAARDTRVTAATDPYVFSKTALTPSTKYYFRVLAFDAGAIGDTTAIDSVTTIAIAAIDQVITKSSTSSSATLSDDLSGGVAPYDSLILHWSTVKANVVNLTARDMKVTAVTDPYVFSKTALTPSTKYYFRVLAFDAGAIGDTTAIDSVSTSAQGAIDQVVSKTSTDTQVTLNDDLSGGTAPYDSLILYWSVTRANIVNLSARDLKITTATDPYQFSKTGLIANTKYYFRIAAFDIGSLGDTTAIDSVTTSVAGLVLLSLNMPDTVCGTYSGYSQTPINDGVIAPRGGTASTWASEESSTSAHWVTIYFSTPKMVQRTRVNWAWNSTRSAFMTSRQYNIQYWDAASSIFRDAAVVNNNTVDSATTSDFTPVTTSRIRYYQPANMGPTIYPAILWLTELQIYGADVQDLTPPVLSGISTSNIAPTTVIVNWVSNEPASSQVEYGPTISYGFSTTLDNTLVLSHSQSLSSLSPSTLYHYRVKSRDAAGNLATSSDFTFTTASTMTLISVNMPDTVCGTYSGYSQTPINDGIIAPRGGTASTWASDESATSAHWVTIYFSSSKVVQRVRVNWAWNNYSSAFMTSRQYNIQYWDASSNVFRNAAAVNNSTVDSATTTDFTPVTTSRIRYYQPANMGPTIYPAILWLTELQVYGYDAPTLAEVNPDEQLIAGDAPQVVQIENATVIPEEYSLMQSYPNPFNASATIEYGLPVASQVSIIIYDVSGRQVEELVNEFQEAGYHKVIWNAGQQASSVYFYRIAASDFVESKKMMLLK